MHYSWYFWTKNLSTKGKLNGSKNILWLGNNSLHFLFHKLLLCLHFLLFLLICWLYELHFKIHKDWSNNSTTRLLSQSSIFMKSSLQSIDKIYSSSSILLVPKWLGSILLGSHVIRYSSLVTLLVNRSILWINSH